MDKERIDGFRSAFAVSDHYALEFMRFLQGQGIRVPENVQIIGFDDTLASRENVPALTTIHQDAVLRARTAIRRLEALRDGTPCDAGILIAQFLGAEEHTEAWRSLDVSLVCGGVLAALFLLTAGGFPAQVLGLYTADDTILRVGAGYFRIVAFSYLPIFGKLGAPAMGVTGAAIATLVSQLLNLLLILIGFAVCLQKEAERPLTVEIWTRWAGVLCLFSEYNGEPDLLFRLAQVKSAAIGDGHAQLIERTGGKFRYSLAVLVCDRPQCRIDLC